MSSALSKHKESRRHYAPGFFYAFRIGIMFDLVNYATHDTYPRRKKLQP